MSNFVSNEVHSSDVLTWNFWNFILFNSFFVQGDEEHNQVSDDPNDNYTNCEIDVKGDDAETELKIFQ